MRKTLIVGGLIALSASGIYAQSNNQFQSEVDAIASEQADLNQQRYDQSVARIKSRCETAKKRFCRIRFRKSNETSIPYEASKKCSRRLNTHDRNGIRRPNTTNAEMRRYYDCTRELTTRMFEERDEEYQSCLRNRKKQLNYCAAHRATLAEGKLPKVTFPAWDRADESEFEQASTGLNARVEKIFQNAENGKASQKPPTQRSNAKIPWTQEEERRAKQQAQATFEEERDRKCRALGAATKPVCGCLHIYPNPKEVKACGI